MRSESGCSNWPNFKNRIPSERLLQFTGTRGSRESPASQACSHKACGLNASAGYDRPFDLKVIICAIFASMHYFHLNRHLFPPSTTQITPISLTRISFLFNK